MELTGLGVPTDDSLVVCQTCGLLLAFAPDGRPRLATRAELDTIPEKVLRPFCTIYGHPITVLEDLPDE